MTRPKSARDIAEPKPPASPRSCPPPRRELPRRDVLGGLAGGTGLLGVGGLLSACTGLVPGQTPPPTLYRLTPKSSFREDLPRVDWQLVLETPVANAALNTTRIALMRSAMRVEYYARSSWTDRAPLMIKTLMIESFENSQKIVSVGREGGGLRADFVLKSEIRELQAEYLDSTVPSANVAMNVKMVAFPLRDIIASESFSRRVTATTDSMDAVVVAFDEALGKVLKDIVEWSLTVGTLAYRRR